MALALLLVPTFMVAQETSGVVDSLHTDEIEDRIPNVSQYDLSECEWVDFCDYPKYAVVTKDGKKGLYDMERHENITDIEFRELYFSRQIEEDSINICYFYFKQGIKQGILGVFTEDNSIMSIYGDDPDEVCELDSCTTIDNRMTKKAKNLLKKFIHKQQLDNAQIVILDAVSGRLKTWIALDADMEKENAGKLLYHSCAASLIKPFFAVLALDRNNISPDSIYDGTTYLEGIRRVNNKMMRQAISQAYRASVAERKWNQFTDTQHPSISPFDIAVCFNSLNHQGKIFMPTLKGDSVSVDEDGFPLTVIQTVQRALRVDRSVFPYLTWLTDKTEWMGYATEEYLYAEGDKKKTMPVGKQLQFAGLFPADHPRYTICVVADKHATNVNAALLQEVINPLTKWLLKN